MNNNSNNVAYFFNKYESLKMGKIIYDKTFYDHIGINQKRWGMLMRQELPILVSECKTLADYLGISVIDFITNPDEKDIPLFAKINAQFVSGIDEICTEKSEIVFGQPNVLYSECLHSLQFWFKNKQGGSIQEIEIGFDKYSLDRFARSILFILATEA